MISLKFAKFRKIWKKNLPFLMSSYRLKFGNHTVFSRGVRHARTAVRLKETSERHGSSYPRLCRCVMFRVRLQALCTVTKWKKNQNSLMFSKNVMFSKTLLLFFLFCVKLQIICFWVCFCFSHIPTMMNIVAIFKWTGAK